MPSSCITWTWCLVTSFWIRTSCVSRSRTLFLHSASGCWSWTSSNSLGAELGLVGLSSDWAGNCAAPIVMAAGELSWWSPAVKTSEVKTSVFTRHAQDSCVCDFHNRGHVILRVKEGLFGGFCFDWQVSQPMAEVTRHYSHVFSHVSDIALWMVMLYLNNYWIDRAGPEAPQFENLYSWWYFWGSNFSTNWHNRQNRQIKNLNVLFSVFGFLEISWCSGVSNKLT